MSMKDNETWFLQPRHAPVIRCKEDWTSITTSADVLRGATLLARSFSDCAEEDSEPKEEDCFQYLLSTQSSSSPKLQAGEIYEAPPHFDLSSSTTAFASPGTQNAVRSRIERFDSTSGTALPSSNECIPLENCTPTLCELVAWPVTPCSSCGTPPTPTSRPYILLKDCQHLLCSVCINTLVNSVSNEPPRQPDCFTCSARVVDFEGVLFDFAKVGVDLDSDHWRTPTRERIWPPGTFSSGTTSDSRVSGWSKMSGSNWSTPESARSYRANVDLSPHNSNEIPVPQAWTVVRLDNIPWDLTIQDVLAWIPSETAQIPEEVQPLGVHILANRGDGRTLNQAYIELPDLISGQSLIRTKNGKKICGRIISVVLSSQEDLLRQVFPAWKPGFAGVNAARSGSEGIMITDDDLEGIVDLGALKASHSLKSAVERSFVQIATILIKFPWHQPELYDGKLIARMFDTTLEILSLLLDRYDDFPNEESFGRTLKIIMAAATGCPGFRQNQKDRLLSLVGIGNFPSALTEPSSSLGHSGPDDPFIPGSAAIAPLRYNYLPTASSQLGADNFEADVPNSIPHLNYDFGRFPSASSSGKTYTRSTRRPLPPLSDLANDGFAPPQLSQSSNRTTGWGTSSPLASQTLTNIPTVRLPKSRAWRDRG